MDLQTAVIICVDFQKQHTSAQSEPFAFWAMKNLNNAVSLLARKKPTSILCHTFCLFCLGFIVALNWGAFPEQVLLKPASILMSSWTGSTPAASEQFSSSSRTAKSIFLNSTTLSGTAMQTFFGENFILAWKGWESYVATALKNNKTLSATLKKVSVWSPTYASPKQTASLSLTHLSAETLQEKTLGSFV